MSIHRGDPTAAIVGESERIRRLRSLIRKLAEAGDATVLVTGGSGTGKDLAARAIHASSPRAGRPFVNVTCTALPSALLESELFGHERGAFTDAKASRRGLFERAAGGTVFLDEIGDMDPRLQAKLLRVLEERCYRRVGSDEDRVADVRIVAATHADLPAAVAAGRFRQDLYYRLAVLVLRMPALRERREDIQGLVHHFVGHFCERLARAPLRVSSAALAALEAHDWPGNVRELRNAIERAVILCEHDTLHPADLELGELPERAATMFALPDAGVDLRQLEHDLLSQALARTRGNVTHAARLLGMSRDQVRYRLQKLPSGRLDASARGARRRGEARQRLEPAVGAGDHARGAHGADEPPDPSGDDELGALDIVGGDVDGSWPRDLGQRHS